MPSPRFMPFLFTPSGSTLISAVLFNEIVKNRGAAFFLLLRPNV
jgi:hypothetical protein